MSRSSDAASNVVVDLGEYIGERNETGERHGIGKAHLPNGDVYNGSYKYGRRDGPGMYFFMRNKAKYEGSYKEGERHGHGTMIYPDGSRYEGTWEHNKRKGYGSYYYVNGDKYEGEWLTDMKHGQGTYEFHHDQTKFKGTWNLGKIEGIGAIEYPGFRYQGFFHDGLPIGMGKFSFNIGYEQKGMYSIEEKEEIVNDERLVYRLPQWISDGKLIHVKTPEMKKRDNTTPLV